MTGEEYDALPAIDRVRRAVRALSACSESFLQRFQIVELMQLHRAWVYSEWDFLPHSWTPRQIEQALCGVAPHWDENELPVAGKVIP